MDRPVTWGIVTTIRAPVRAILDFAAHHIELGAHRLILHLDEDRPEARQALERLPQCRVIVTDAAWWGRRQRPEAHQGRQTWNATRAYRRNPGVDWLTHIDVDEFLWPARPVADQLASLPADALTARIRPIEALATDDTSQGTWFKGCAARSNLRARQTGDIYPTYGSYLNGGFLSHVSGKIFVRTGLERINLRIHNAFQDGTQIPNNHDLDDTLLCHFHAPSWDDWQRAYRYRLQNGSYRGTLKGSGTHGVSMNALFTAIEADGGEPALRAFYHEVCTATPDLRQRLAAHGLLHLVDLGLDASRARIFPEHA